MRSAWIGAVVTLGLLLGGCYGDVEGDVKKWRDQACACAEIDCACAEACASGDSACQSCNETCKLQRNTCSRKAAQLRSAYEKKYSRFQANRSQLRQYAADAQACLAKIR